MVVARVGCALAAVAGAIAYGVTAALQQASSGQVNVPVEMLDQLGARITTLSVAEFVEAFALGTAATVLSIVYPRGGEG